MSTNMSKGKNTKGVTVSLFLAKRAKKAAGCKQVPVTPIQDLDQTIEEEDQASG